MFEILRFTTFRSESLKRNSVSGIQNFPFLVKTILLKKI